MRRLHIYSSRLCPICEAVRKYFKFYNVKVLETFVDDDDQLKAKYKALPTILAIDEIKVVQTIDGYTPASMQAILDWIYDKPKKKKQRKRK